MDNSQLCQWAQENEDDLIEFASLIKRYPNEPVLNLWLEVFEPAPELSPAEYDIG